MKKTKLFGGFLTISLLSAALAGCGGGNGQAENGAAGGSNKGEPKKLVISTWGFSEDFFRKEV